YAPPPRAAYAARGDLHPGGEPHHPHSLAAVPATGGLSRTRNGEGRRRTAPLAMLKLTGMAETDVWRPEGPGPAVVSGRPGLDSAKRSSLPAPVERGSDLAAGHLQGPARTVNQRLDHLLSLVWPG